MALRSTETPGGADRAGEGPYLPDCGGSEPVPNDEVLARPDGDAEVPMDCEACEGTSEMALDLSPEEAKALGLHSLGEHPQAP